MSKSILRVPRDIYDFRIKLMKRLLDLGANPLMIEMQARSLIRCFPRRSLGDMWNVWKWHFPTWVIWICSAEYREVCRVEVDPDFEEKLRDLLRPRPAQPSEPTSPAPVAPSSPESADPIPPEIGDTPA